MNKQLKIIGIGSSIAVVTLLLIISIALLTSKIRYEVNDFTGRKQLLALTIEQQTAIGDAVEDEEENEDASSYNTQRVNRIGHKLLNDNGLMPNKFNIKFFVIKDTNATINAFAQIGGHIYMSRSLLDSCRNDSEVAFILAHEIAHVHAQHGAEKWTKTALLKHVFNFEDNDIASIFGSKMVDLTKLSFSRNLETEADYFAIRLMINADFDPTAGLDCFYFFEGLGKQPNVLFNDHPNFSTRRKTVEKAMEAFKSERM